MKKHKHENCQVGKLEWDECEKCLKKQENLDDHKSKSHVKYVCDDCDKVFRYEAVLEKHVEAVHEDLTLYCHYYTNEKVCPCVDESIYLHEESDRCKFGGSYERMMCMFTFRHAKCKDDDNEDSDEDGSDDEEDSWEHRRNQTNSGQV